MISAYARCLALTAPRGRTQSRRCRRAADSDDAGLCRYHAWWFGEHPELDARFSEADDAEVK